MSKQRASDTLTARQQLRAWWLDAPRSAPRVAGAALLALAVAAGIVLLLGVVGFGPAAVAVLFFVLPVIVLVASLVGMLGGALVLSVPCLLVWVSWIAQLASAA